MHSPTTIVGVLALNRYSGSSRTRLNAERPPRIREASTGMQTGREGLVGAANARIYACTHVSRRHVRLIRTRRRARDSTKTGIASVGLQRVRRRRRRQRAVAPPPDRPGSMSPCPLWWVGGPAVRARPPRRPARRVTRRRFPLQ